MSKSFFKVVSENLMFLLLLLGIILGIVLGLFLNDKVQHSTEFTPRELAMFIGFPGELFLRMLMLVVLPLIVSSVITSLTIIDKNTAKKVGKRAAFYFLVASLIATSLAVVLGRVMIKPRAHEIQEEDTKPNTGSSPMYAILDMLR
ncbi:excitatory amino acid transporter 1-like [Paramuricea clavata]|uniref:Amino acid transporter n=1 Tax=Paramuricea clavata TaxID=317549 RepID=A0A6S7HLR6_PARCT|nr:excitatory amino acid transporter 1-like [Paramuricea clavata]